MSNSSVLMIVSISASSHSSEDQEKAKYRDSIVYAALLSKGPIENSVLQQFQSLIKKYSLKTNNIQDTFINS